MRASERASEREREGGRERDSPTERERDLPPQPRLTEAGRQAVRGRAGQGMAWLHHECVTVADALTCIALVDVISSVDLCLERNELAANLNEQRVGWLHEVDVREVGGDAIFVEIGPVRRARDVGRGDILGEVGGDVPGKCREGGGHAQAAHAGQHLDVEVLALLHPVRGERAAEATHVAHPEPGKEGRA